MKLLDKILLLNLFFSVLIPGLGLSNVKTDILHRGQPQWVFLDGNRIRSYIWDTGVLDQNPTLNNSPGFEWPKGSGKYAIFTAGLTVAAYVNGELRMAANSYTGELGPGAIIGGVPTTNSSFKLYKINDWDNCQSNPDYANWGLMVPYGAPYIDLNHNGQYDDCIDKPGVLFASQTVFAALTDGFPENHDTSEGFGGGTVPMNADFRLTAWCYNLAGIEDIQFLKWDIINQNAVKWDSTHFAITTDMDLGDATDDYIGCDTITDMGYTYNSDNDDGGGTGTYGLNPPAVGIQFFRTPTLNSVQLGMTSFTYFTNPGSGGAACEQDPNTPMEAYNCLKGLKKDGTPWLNPEFNPPLKTKYCYPGNPEGGGWNEFMGSIRNCGGDTTGTVQPNFGGDRRVTIGSGSPQLTINSGDTQTVIIGQHIDRGSSNINSTSKLLNAAQIYKYLFDNNFTFSVSGTIRYSDNGNPVPGGYVKAVKIDGNTGQIMTMDSTIINPNGTYTLNSVPVTEVDIMAYPSSEIEDFVPTYYPGSTSWQSAISIVADSNLTGIDISAIRTSSTLSKFPVKAFINGIVISDSIQNSLRDAIIYLKKNNNYYSFDISNDSGRYTIQPEETGLYTVFVNRLGFSSDSVSINVADLNSTYEANFSLKQMYVGIVNNNTFIPEGYSLFQNYPNPFNPATKIKFHLPGNDFVSLVVYDMTGRKVATLVNNRLPRGEYIYNFDGGSLPSGIYFYTLMTENYKQTKKMVLIK